MKKALIVVTNHDRLGSTGKKTGWYLPEVTHLYYPLIEAGYVVDFASPKGGMAPMDPNSLKGDDELGKRFVADASVFGRLSSTLALADVRPDSYGVIFFAGGHGTMWDFAHSESLNRVTAGIYENGGIVAAVCHGPAALINVTLSNGRYLVAEKDVCAFTDEEEDAVGLTSIVPFLLEATLRKRGARFIRGPKWQDNVVVSERLITGQNPQSAGSLAQRLIELASVVA